MEEANSETSGKCSRKPGVRPRLLRGGGDLACPDSPFWGCGNLLHRESNL